MRMGGPPMGGPPRGGPPPRGTESDNWQRSTNLPAIPVSRQSALHKTDQRYEVRAEALFSYRQLASV